MFKRRLVLRYRIAFMSALIPLLILGAGCPARHAARTDSPAQAVVESFLLAMIDDDEELQAAMISPAWLAENDIDLDYDDYFINGYGLTGYAITDISGEVVTVLIQFDDGAAHQLTFRARAENDQWYIVPGSYDEEDWDESGWVDPWIEVIEDVR